MGHDGKGRGDGWHCAKLVARCLDEEDNAVEYTFLCDRWLDKEEEDGQLQVGGGMVLVVIWWWLWWW